MKRRIEPVRKDVWKFYVHDNGTWAWKHRNSAYELVGHTDGFKTLEECMADARLNGFKDDHEHKIRE